MITREQVNKKMDALIVREDTTYITDCEDFRDWLFENWKPEITAEDAVKFLVEKGWRITNENGSTLFQDMNDKGVFIYKTRGSQNQAFQLEIALQFFLDDWQPASPATTTAIVSNISTSYGGPQIEQTVTVNVTTTKGCLFDKAGSLSQEAAKKIYEILKEDLSGV